ncbi:MAG TPA: tRNA (adenosine(37)-N6)-threonylcarbamoyltransferase complex ATPase subunit type 1 TsaE [Gemmatales bacterium]|nr:tRNA (adenosine(37)-N6)-threonylcarbamoyltransferase complex ATPase subunit type 1 TsaE [Gemmatales bacterium]HMP60632.1 tRNA (adenosine(37)-N6)-threonylcarbamoyltransferase complex ATPase subunit type 1 TsaE [Gemmatales bacterium]
MGSILFPLPDLPATLAWGEALGRRLFPGAVVGLSGPLGAGKTTLVQAMAQGLEVADPLAVVSPTFVLHQEHAGRLTLHHFDVYRLTSPQAFLDLGAAEIMDGPGVTVIEWADRVLETLPPERLLLTLRLLSPTAREIDATACGPRHAALLAGL